MACDLSIQPHPLRLAVVNVITQMSKPYNYSEAEKKVKALIESMHAADLKQYNLQSFEVALNANLEKLKFDTTKANTIQFVAKSIMEVVPEAAAPIHQKASSKTAAPTVPLKAAAMPPSGSMKPQAAISAPPPLSLGTAASPSSPKLDEKQRRISGSEPVKNINAGVSGVLSSALAPDISNAIEAEKKSLLASVKDEAHQWAVKIGYELQQYLQTHAMLSEGLLYVTPEKEDQRTDAEEMQKLVNLILASKDYEFIKVELEILAQGFETMLKQGKAQKLNPMTKAVCAILAKTRSLKPDVRKEQENKLMASIKSRTYFHNITHEKYTDLKAAKLIVKACPVGYGLLCNPSTLAHPPGLFFMLEKLDSKVVGVYKISCREETVVFCHKSYSSLEACFESITFNKFIYRYTGPQYWKQFNYYEDNINENSPINHFDYIPEGSFILCASTIPGFPCLSVNREGNIEHYLIVPQADGVFMNGHFYHSFDKMIETLEESHGLTPFVPEE